jgi:hypothetical protein
MYAQGSEERTTRRQLQAAEIQAANGEQVVMIEQSRQDGIRLRFGFG